MKLAILAVAIACAIATTSYADDAKAQSARAASEAAAKFNSGDFVGAAEKFKLAYESDPDPGYLYNIAQAYRFARDCPNAADYYRRFLVKVPNPPNLTQVQGALADQEACTKERAANAVRDGEAKLSGGHYAEAAEEFKRAYQLDTAVEHLFQIGEAYRLAHDCANAAAYYGRYAAAAPDAPNIEPAKRLFAEQDRCAHPAPAVVDSGKRTLAIVAAGVGVASLGVAGFFTWDAHYLAGARDRTCTLVAACPPEQYADYNDRGHRAATIAIATYAVGGAALLAGVWFYLRSSHPAESAVAITPTSNGAAIVGRF